MSDPALLPLIQHIVLDIIEGRGGPRAPDPMDGPAAWDSYALVEIIFAIEDRFGFEMTSAEMESITGIEDLLAVVERHRSSAAA